MNNFIDIMSELKDKFKNYTQQPDERVWQSINDTMKKRAIVRRSGVALSAVAIIGAALIFVLGRNGSADLVAENNAVLVENIQLAQTDATENVAVVENVTSEVVQQVTKERESQAAIEEKLEENDVSGFDYVTPVVNEVVQTIESKETLPVIKNEVKTSTEKNAVTDMLPTIEPVRKKEEKQQSKIQQHKAVADDLVVWIPNAFAPDDPLNDEIRQFKVFPNNGSNILSYEIFIYSRNGRQVYHSKDINAGWDGTYNGHAQPMGTYVYIIELNDASKGLQHKKGTVTLVR
jgi:gliding motility-associated-like protein